jgi:hypothetical protein
MDEKHWSSPTTFFSAIIVSLLGGKPISLNKYGWFELDWIESADDIVKIKAFALHCKVAPSSTLKKLKIE